MSSFNFTNVEINSGRKQIIDILDDKKVIDDRIEGIERRKKQPLLRVWRSDFFMAILNGRCLTKNWLHQSEMALCIRQWIALQSPLVICYVSTNCIQFLTCLMGSISWGFGCFIVCNNIIKIGNSVFIVSSYFKPFFSISMYYFMRNKYCINKIRLATIWTPNVKWKKIESKYHFIKYLKNPIRWHAWNT